MKFKLHYTRQESSMIHSASPPSRPTVIVAWFWRFGTDGQADWRTLCVKIVITTGRDCGRPRGSKNSDLTSIWCDLKPITKLSSCLYFLTQCDKGLRVEAMIYLLLIGSRANISFLSRVHIENQITLPSEYFRNWHSKAACC